MDCPLHDSLLRVHYKGMLLNEEKTLFYDTRVNNDGEPLEFCSGEGLVSIILLSFHKFLSWNLFVFNGPTFIKIFNWKCLSSLLLLSINNSNKWIWILIGWSCVRSIATLSVIKLLTLF